jgi:hypothetical protein
MNKKAIAIAVLIGFGTFAQAGNVYSPDKGVICDKKSGFCADKYGISLGLTQEYLGDKHAATWEKRLSNPNFDPSAFTMSNGLSCDTKAKVCKKSKWDDNADPKWTGILFGNVHHKKAHTSQVWTKGMKEAANECELYLANKYGLPMAAYSATHAKKHNGGYVITIVSEWDEPRVEETGKCTVKGGNVSYHRTSN